MSVAFHLTPSRQVPKILKDGLLPKLGPRSRKAGEPYPAIFFFPTKDDLIGGYCSWFESCFSEDARIALLAVNIADGIASRSDVAYEFCIREAIATDNIEVLSRDIGGLRESEMEVLIDACLTRQDAAWSLA